MTPEPDRAATLADTLRMATAIADRAAVSLIECECHLEHRPTGPWWDTRPLLDPREMSPEFADLNAVELRYAELRGLILRHSEAPHLVRIVHNHNTRP